MAASPAVLSGILLHYASNRADTYAVLALVATVGSFLTSYAPACAKCFIGSCSVGLFERPHRVAVLILAGFSGLLPAALRILAVAANVTVAQRTFHVRRSIQNGPEKRPDPDDH